MLSALSSPQSGKGLDRAFWLIGFVGICLAVAALVALVSIARDADVRERHYEAGLVQRGVEFRVAELEKELRPHIIWDEAMVNVDHRFDLEWVRKNVSLPIAAGYGHSSLFIISGTGVPIYAINGVKDVSPTDFQRFASVSEPLIAKLREQERRARENGGVPPPLQASVTAQVGGANVLITASVFQGDFAAKPIGDRAPVLISVMPVDRAFTTVLKSRYALNAPAIVGNADPVKSAALLPSTSGRQLLLQWPPRAPGSELLSRTLAPLVTLFAMLGLVFAMLIKASRSVVAQLIASEEEARHRALTDPLSGLGNRAYLTSVLEKSISRLADGHFFAVLLIDLDHFKAINDNWGHETGDEVIVQTAEMLKAVAGPEWEIARHGGDEFIVVLPAAGQADVQQACRRILNRNGAWQLKKGGAIKVSCSIGATLIDDATVTPADAIRAADRSLYAAKVSGRGTATLTSDMSAMEMSVGAHKDSGAEASRAFPEAVIDDQLPWNDRPA